MPKTPTLLSPLQVAMILKVSPRTVARWADDGKLTVAAHTAGGQRRFDPIAVAEFAREMAA